MLLEILHGYMNRLITGSLKSRHNEVASAMATTSLDIATWLAFLHRSVAVNMVAKIL